MRARRAGRNHRPRNLPVQTDVVLENNEATFPGAGRMIETAHSFWVQAADLVSCDVDGCPAPAEPEAWEPIDLDTGDELPARFCEEHQLAWFTRPCETIPPARDLVST